MTTTQLSDLLSKIDKDTPLTVSTALEISPFTRPPTLTLWPFDIETMAAELQQLTHFLGNDFARFAWINHPASFEMPEEGYTEGWISNALAITVGYQEDQKFVSLTDVQATKGLDLYFSHAARLTALQPLLLQLLDQAIKAYAAESSTLALVPVDAEARDAAEPKVNSTAPMSDLVSTVGQAMISSESPYSIAIHNACTNLPGTSLGGVDAVLQSNPTPRQIGQLIGIELSDFGGYMLSLSADNWNQIIAILSNAESRDDFFIGIAETFAYANSYEYCNDPDLDEGIFILDNTLGNFEGDVAQLEGIITPVEDFISAVEAKYQLLASGKLNRDPALELTEQPVSDSVTNSTQQTVSLRLQQEFERYDHANFTVASLKNDPCLLLTKSDLCTLQPLPEGNPVSFENPEEFQGVWGHNASKMFARHNIITYDGRQTEVCMYWGLHDDNEIFNVTELKQDAEHVNVSACGQYVAMQVGKVIKVWHIAEQEWLTDFPLPTDEDLEDIKKINYIPEQQICLVQITYGNLLRLDNSGVTHRFDYDDPSYFSYSATLFDVHPKTSQILVGSVILSMDDLSIIEELPRFSIGIDESELAWIWHPKQACVVAFSSRGIKTFDTESRRWHLLSAEEIRFDDDDPARQPKFNHNGEYLLTYNWEEQDRYQLWNWRSIIR